MQAAIEHVQVSVFSSKLGWMAAAGRGDILLELTFGHASPRQAFAALHPDVLAAAREADWNPRLARRLQAYAAGEPEDFCDVPLDESPLSPFQRRVLRLCRRIPFGQTVTYGKLAARAGWPGAARAVGNVMAANRTPLIVPCHRVVASGGRIGHYSAAGGRRMKLRLLESEGAYLECGDSSPLFFFSSFRRRTRRTSNSSTAVVRSG